MHLFNPQHVKLLNSCYPPSSVLLTAGPDYSPNSHELSRLTYYACVHCLSLVGWIKYISTTDRIIQASWPKLGVTWRNVLRPSATKQKQVMFAPEREFNYLKYASMALNEVSFSSLLISLAIFRALATECRRDIALLSPSLIASVDCTLVSVPSDLEVTARAASVVCCPLICFFVLFIISPCPVHSLDHLYKRSPYRY